MKYIVYTIVCLIFIALLYLTCFVWQWGGWISCVGHIIAIIVLVMLFLFLMIELFFYYNRGTIWKTVHNTILAPIQVAIELSMNPFWWFDEKKDEKFRQRLRELTGD